MAFFPENALEANHLRKTSLGADLWPNGTH